MTETFGFAFKPLSEGGAGLDFITLSDYVVPTAWGEIGRYQGNYPGKLIARSSEVITYRGHTNNHTSAQLRRLPHRADLRARSRRVTGAETAREAAAQAVRRRAPRRRVHADQPPDDLSVDRSVLPAVLPGLPVGLHRRGDRLLEGRRDRGLDRPAAAHQPVHAARRSRSTSARFRSATRSRRSARATRTTPGAPRASCRRRRRWGRPRRWSTRTELSEDGHPARREARATPT